MQTILIIEDEPSLREIVSFNLKKNFYNVIETENANDALIILEQTIPDLILLDIMLPGLKGTQFLSILKTNDKLKHIPVIIISAKDDEESIVNHLEMGAIDYLTKPFSIRVLLAKIKKYLKNIVTDESHKEVIRYQGITLDKTNHKVFVENEEIPLTYKEFLLLELFLSSPKRIFTRDQLLTNIWGYESDVYSRTVDAHISSLRKKLKEKGKHIKTVPKLGYKVE